ncbi:uncharacterized protein LOC123553852 isoform X2 [Mercenaria mercenaria]|nr:uncharacterized protein LOC123553852 isoform X2 [Mercenaria mercenaria]
MWTGWYNTDTPTTGGGDDESIASIRKRGYEICDGNSPIDTICRDVRAHANMFNSETTEFAKDKLFIPCNTLGLLCRNQDQRNSTCRDYEIRFECLSASELPAPENLGVIGVAAGLSVIVPILCVAIMHIARLMKEHRNLSRQSLVGNSEQSVQTDLADLPPSYSFLFGEDTADSESGLANINPARISLTGSSGDLRLPNTRLSSSSLQSVTENQTNLNASFQGEEGVSQTAQSSSDTQRRTSWRSRFPNMHLSVFDLFYPSGQRSEPPSPDLSYVQTPPPTYKDAIVILGGEPFTLSENGDVGEKI